MAQALDKDGERPADIPTFGSWVLTYLQGAARVRKASFECAPALLLPALRVWKNRRLDTITWLDCEQLLMGMTGGGDAFATVCLRCATTRKMFRLAVDAGLIPGNPWRGVILPRPASRGRFLARGEEAILKSKLAPPWARFVTVALGTGLSGSEILKITPAHRRNRCLYIPARMVKSRPARVIPLRPEVERALNEQTPPDFTSTYWPCSDHAYPAAMLRNMAISLGWAKLTPAVLRTTFGMRCAESRMPVSQLQALMGHRRPEITAAYYAHLPGPA